MSFHLMSAVPLLRIHMSAQISAQEGDRSRQILPRHFPPFPREILHAQKCHTTQTHDFDPLSSCRFRTDFVHLANVPLK